SVRKNESKNFASNTPKKTILFLYTKTVQAKFNRYNGLCLVIKPCNRSQVFEGFFMIYDITRTVSPTTHPWIGDTPYSLIPMLKIGDGASVNLMTMTTTCHIGTHADAYYHYEDDGDHPAQMPLENYIGQARVVTIERQEGALTL